MRKLLNSLLMATVISGVVLGVSEVCAGSKSKNNSVSSAVMPVVTKAGYKAAGYVIDGQSSKIIGTAEKTVEKVVGKGTTALTGNRQVGNLAQKGVSKAGDVVADATKGEKAAITVTKEGKQAVKAPQKLKEGADKITQADPVDTAHEINAIQYPILILEGLEARKGKNFTKNVAVKQAPELQKRQGSPSPSEISQDISLTGTTLSCAANSMALLLQNNPIDLTLLDMDDLDMDVVTDKVIARDRRQLLMQQYALAAEVIGEGSNAISSDFYARVKEIADAIPETYGTLGAMSVLNDSERYPYFEMVRQTALSAVQLGLSGAVTLSNLRTINDETVEGGNQ